ncbi:MAG: hypothetical protein IJM36_02615 [Acholeplasmatales bacterium]|nr:hypothetical protein [Acholeplasmatales bacterium]
MKKRFLVGSAVALSVLGFSLCTVNANATTEDVVTNDNFVFDANTLTTGYGYNNGVSFASKSNMSVKLGKNYQAYPVNANFDFGDYNFTYGLLPYYQKASKKRSLFDDIYDALGMNSYTNYGQFYISAEKGTKCGVYYTVVDKTPVNNTYYVSSNNEVEVISEKKNSYTTVDTFTEQFDSMYYSEFTFGSTTTLGLKSDDQYICLFGVTIVTEEEIENRATSNQAVEDLINYYNTNGLSTSEEFTSLVEAAKASLVNVNHLSQIDNYDEYKDILVKYDELVNVESKIDLLKDTTKRGYNLNVRYDAETKALLDDIANEIFTANELGITNNEISNYDLYLAALNRYSELEADYANAAAVVELINNLGDVEYTEEYKQALDTIEAAYDNVIDQSLVSNYDEFLAKKEAFDALSNAAKEAFTNKVAEANEVKGETSSYTLINEAEELYNALIASDKEAVAEAYNTLEEVKNAYAAYEAEVTNNTVVFDYNEDGSIKNIYFIGTINGFTSTQDIDTITMVISNLDTNETEEFNITKVSKSLTLNGEYVKTKQDGVRYIFTKVANTDGMFDGVEFSMTYSVEYKDGHVVTSNPSTVVIGA